MPKKLIMKELLIFISLLFITRCEKNPTSSQDTGTVTDINGNTYQTVKIGDQLWMAENLKTTHYRNGAVIPRVTSNSEWSNLDDSQTGACCYYDNDDSNADAYGCLYNWYAVNDSRNIAPEGWHVPADVEWQILIDHLGGQKVAGAKLKEAGAIHWYLSNAGADNASGFTALPGGYRDTNGSYRYIRYIACFWSRTEDQSYSGWAWYRKLFASYNGIVRFSYGKNHGYAVRCIKN